ncbi:MAG: CoA transferase, partial [Alphaproteobacteria bacterium]
MTQEETAHGALSGLKVIDLTRVLAGPFCTQILADHGADVLKVESPEGDETRRWGPPFVGDASAYFMNVNRNKRGIILNLREQEGRDALAGLLEGADVLVENFKPGTLDKWGFGRNALEQRYPRLVHCCISGFGETGPYGGMPGYDAAIQAMSGLMSINGEPDGPPLRIGAPVVDMVTGLNAAIGILMALHERSSSGKGQYVDAALFDGALSILHPYSAN